MFHERTEYTSPRPVQKKKLLTNELTARTKSKKFHFFFVFQYLLDTLFVLFVSRRTFFRLHCFVRRKRILLFRRVFCVSVSSRVSPFPTRPVDPSAFAPALLLALPPKALTAPPGRGGAMNVLKALSHPRAHAYLPLHRKR